MRIGLVSGEYPPMKGGVGACSRILAQQLGAAGHDLQIFSDSRASSDEFPLAAASRGWSLQTLLALRSWARHQQLDIVNLQFQTAAFGMSPWIHFLPHFLGQVPVVTTFHDLRVPWLFPKAGALRQRLVLHLARSSSAVICTNHEDHVRLAGQGRHAWMIPIGSNILEQRPDSFDAQAWRQRAGLANDEILLAWFGLVNHSKGLTTLYESMAGLRETGLQLRLVIIGGEPGDSDHSNPVFLDSLGELANRLGLEPALLRTGYIAEAEVAAWLWASDLVVLPFQDGASFRRGSLMAAIQHGCATVTTLPGVDIPEFVHGHNLWLVPTNDALALGEALRTLVASPECRDKLRQGATQLADRFDWQAIAAAYCACFEAVLKDRRL